MDRAAERSTNSDRPEELRPSLAELEKAVAKPPARGVPKPLFIAVAALAAVLGMVAAYLLYFDSDYRRNMALVRADNEYLRQERDEAQAGLAAAQEELAQAQGIPVQRDIMRAGGTDAGAIHTARMGACTGGISIPCRYIHTPAETADLGDAEQCVRLAAALIQSGS